MSVRKHRNKWLCTITHNGKPSYKTFDKRRDALDYDAKHRTQIVEGTYIADNATVTVAEASDLWLTGCEERNLENSTIRRNRQHVDKHIEPFIGTLKLSKLTLPALRAFQTKLREEGRSAAMVKAVTTSLSGILSEAQERGLLNKNVVKEKPRRRGNAEARHKRKLVVGEDIPLPQEVTALFAALTERWQPIIKTAVFTGLRASELRGLRWQDIDLDGRQINVRQRIDNFGAVGSLKSATSRRTVPLPSVLVKTLKEHKLASRFSKPDDLIFCNGAGNSENLSNIVRRGLIPAWREAGIIGRYGGMHSLRHFYASWCINRKVDGGRELPAKIVSERLGHSSIVVTMDVYGHLFPAQVADEGFDDAAALLAMRTD